MGTTRIFGLAQELAANSAGKTVAERLGYSVGSRLLVIEAEDLGLAHSIDRATFEALDKGWVTSAEVLVPAPWFAEVAQWSKSHPNADIGVRLDLNSDWIACRWRPVANLLPESGMIDNNGYLSASWHYVEHHARAEDAERETRAQIEQARRTGIQITHLGNYMKTITQTPALFSVYWKLGLEYKVPISLPNQSVVAGGLANGQIYKYGGIAVDIRMLPIDSVLGMAPGIAQADWLSAYEKTLERLPAGVYLLSMNLGYNDEEMKGLAGNRTDWGAQWRQNDLEVVSNPAFQKFLKDKGFILVSWRNLRKAMPEHP